MKGWLAIGMCAICANLFAQAATIKLRDPTQPPLAATANMPTANEASQYNLTSILIAHNRKIAVINGKALTVGDTINASKIINIQTHQVFIQGPVGVIELPLLATPVKTRSKP